MAEPRLTEWLTRLREGDDQALDHILPVVYDELRGLARAQLRSEDVGHTLNATALVHEAYLRLADRRELRPRDRRHFFAIAAQCMRRVLVDHARGRKRQKRGSGAVVLSLEHAATEWAQEASDDLVILDQALDRLAAASPRAARVVEQRFFGGLSLQETAVSLGISLKTVQRDWLIARAWMQKELEVAGIGNQADGADATIDALPARGPD